MSYQPPPPPSPGPGRPAAGFDPKSVNPLDWGIIAAGVLAFLFSFISFYSSVDVEVEGRTVTYDEGGSAWSDIVGGGFFAWFAMIFAIVGAVAVAIGLFAPTVQLPFAARLGGLAAFAAALVFEIIAIFVTPGDSGSAFGSDVSASANHGFGFWASLIIIAAGAAMSLMRFQATGGQLPGNLQGRVPNVGGYGPQGGMTGSQPAPPAAGSVPPPPPPAGSAPPPPPSPGYGPPQ